MAVPVCKVLRATPDPRALRAIPIETKADPCPMNSGQSSLHTITLSNQRPSSIYNVDFVSKALFSLIEFSPGTNEWHHSEPVITQGIYQRDHSIIAQTGSQGSTDEIECAVKLHDATQKSSSGFSGPKAATDLTYSIQIK